jgi:hypothetical protein
LLEAVGESQYEIWLEPLELLAVDRDGTLVLSAPAATASWLRTRFGRLIARCAESVGRELRLADEAERAAAATLPASSGTPAAIAGMPRPSANESPDRSPSRPSDFADAGVSGQRAARSADSSACPHAHNQRREAR